MDRRGFLCRLTAAGAVGAAVGGELGCGSAAARVTYQVRGFTCVTCAVGLEVMLRDVRGVIEAAASYPDNSVTISFDKQTIGEGSLKQFISDCGFSVAV